MSGIFDQIINYSPPLIVSGTVNYKGTWNASTNNPTLNNPPAASTKGDYYVVSTSGTQFSISFVTGDWIISNGTAWEKVDLTDAVSSVFGRTGAVVGVSTDYSAVGLTNTAIGAANPSSGSFTSLSSSSTTTLNGTTVPASKTLVVTTDKLSALASTTSSELAGVISDETGSGALVFGTSPTIATPVIAQINDANGNSTLRLTGITSATDYLEIKNGIGVGSPLHVLAEGASTNIGVHLQPKGSGLFTISDGTDFNKGIRFRSSSSAASAVTLIDAVSTAGRVVTLPDATGTLLYGGGPLGTPSSGTVTNLTGTASININGTVGATTPSTGRFTTVRLDNTDVLTWGGVYGAGIPSILGSTGAGELQFRPTGSTNGTVATLTSTGLNSTAIGATTPSTGAFTTLSATGNILGSGTNVGISDPTFPLIGTNGIGAAFRQLASTQIYGADFRRWTGTSAEHSVAYIGQYSNGAGAFPIGIYYDAAKTSNTQATTRIVSIDQTGLQVTGALSATGALAIGNTVAAAVAVASTHKVTIVIGGVTYYLLATNV